MKQRILIPTQDAEGTSLAGHFGRAPFFTVVDIENDQVVSREVHPNRSEHSGGRGHAHDNVLSLQPTVMIVNGMGPRGLRSFESQNIPVLKANSMSIDALVTSFTKKELSELTEGCSEAHHH
jgi:predicted Fe-Mo cluster-binding NifX family protein